MHKGSCLCGTIKLEIKANLKHAINCHCQYCRKSHGSPYITILVVLPNNLMMLSGENNLKRYPEDENKTGRFICDKCGSHIYTESKKGLPVSVNTSVLDDESKIEIMAHTNIESKSSMVHITDELPTFHGNMKQEDYMNLIS